LRDWDPLVHKSGIRFGKARSIRPHIQGRAILNHFVEFAEIVGGGTLTVETPTDSSQYLVGE
jgi:hypothetical protein